MKFLSLILFVLSLAAPVRAQASDSKYGPRPANSIFDPTDVLTDAQRKAISEPLDEIRKNENIDIIIVIIPKIGDTPPALIASGFSEQWSTSKLNAIVLHVPGNPDSPWIFPGEILSKVIKPESLKDAIDSASKRAAAEPSDEGKVRAASTEAADALRYWAGGAVLVSETILNQRLAQQLATEKRQRLYKLAAVLGAAASIPIILGLFLIFIRLKNSGSRTFPQTRKIARLGAPYSGGNNAVSRIPPSP